MPTMTNKPAQDAGNDRRAQEAMDNLPQFAKDAIQEAEAEPAREPIRFAIEPPQAPIVPGNATAAPRCFSLEGYTDKTGNVKMQRCLSISYLMDAVLNQEAAMELWGMPEKAIEYWKQYNYVQLLSAAGLATGAGVSVLADKDKRTPEQTEVIAALQAQEKQNRMDAYVNSNFGAAVAHIKEYCAAAELDAGTLDIAYTAALYYFATYPYAAMSTHRIAPNNPNSLTDDDKAELIDTFTALYTYHAKHKGLKDERELLEAFIGAEPAQEGSPQEQAEEMLESIARLNATAIVPPKFIMANNKLTNSMERATQKAEKDGTLNREIEMMLTVSGRKKKNEVNSMCVLSYDWNKLHIDGQKAFTRYDRAVHDAVVSLYVAGNPRFTPDMVWRAMTGKTAQEQPSPVIRAKVEASIDKMRCMLVKVDYTKELEMRRITNIKGRRTANLLVLIDDELESTNGNRVRAYKFPEDAEFAPILYLYSAQVGQVISVPIGLLDTKQIGRNGKPSTHSLKYTDRRVAIRHYLIQRIEIMKGKNTQVVRKIKLKDYVTTDKEEHDGLYTIAGHPELSQPMPEKLTDEQRTNWKNTMRNIRNDAEAILKDLITKKYIKGYSVYRISGKPAGFTIELYEDDKRAHK